MIRRTLVAPVIVGALALAGVTTNALGKPQAPTAKNGYWQATSDHATIKLRVERHKVVSVFIDALPTVGSGPHPDATCGHQYYGFVGPLDPYNPSSRHSFHFKGDTGFDIGGTFTSARKLSGSLTVNPGAYRCSFKQEPFVAKFVGED